MENQVTVVNQMLPISAKEMQLQVNAIQDMMKQVMIEDVHYGKVPGCGDKPALLKPGAEKVGLMFGLAAKFTWVKTELPNGHREYEITCTLESRAGTVMGQGVGCCSTMESKYRYRGNEAVSTGKPVPRAYWDNNRDPSTIGGRGFVAQKIDGAWMICEKGEKKENPDIADVYNTVLKIGKKRAHVDAILTVTAASDIFTQDIEEFAPEIVATMAKTEAPKKEPAKFAPTFVYNIPYNESQKLNPRSLGCTYDRDTKLWSGPEVACLLPFMEASKSKLVQRAEVNHDRLEDEMDKGYEASLLRD